MPRISFLEKSGARRTFLCPRAGGDILVMPGTHDMPDADWAHLNDHPSAAGFLDRGELFEAEEEKPKPRKVKTQKTEAPPEKTAADHDAADLAEFVKQISAMSVEDATAALAEVDVKAAFVALLAKDNREAIRLLCQERLRNLA